MFTSSLIKSLFYYSQSCSSLEELGVQEKKPHLSFYFHSKKDFRVFIAHCFEKYLNQHGAWEGYKYCTDGLYSRCTYWRCRQFKHMFSLCTWFVIPNEAQFPLKSTQKISNPVLNIFNFVSCSENNTFNWSQLDCLSVQLVTVERFKYIHVC